MAYEVTADLFRGPLSLMVELAKHRLLDVFLVKVQALTSEYRAWLRVDDGASLDRLAEPLPLLGQLLAIKSRALMPAPQIPQHEDEEEAVSLEELERRIREYEQFKSIANVLAELHALQHERLTRFSPKPPAPMTDETDAADHPPLAVGIVDLMSAFAKVIEQARAPVYAIEGEAWTVEMKVTELRTLLTVQKQVGFHQLFSPAKTTLELVCTFLALLELVRQRLCAAIQERHFDEILIVRQEPRDG